MIEKADWVEEVRLEAITDAKKYNAANPDQPQIDPDQEARDALGTLYNSAEGYLEMWERNGKPLSPTAQTKTPPWRGFLFQATRIVITCEVA